MKRVAVLVSGGGTNLQALLESEQRGENPNGKIVLVVASKPGVYALERAANFGVESAVVSRRDYASSADFDAALLGVLQAHDIDVVVLAGFLSVLGERVIAAYRNKIINVHPSLIPSFCGPGFYGIWSMRNVTAGRSCCKRPWPFSPATPPRLCRSASWWRPSGSYCPRRWPWCAATRYKL